MKTASEATGARMEVHEANAHRASVEIIAVDSCERETRIVGALTKSALIRIAEQAMRAAHAIQLMEDAS